MSLAEPVESRLDEALARLKRDGGPVSVGLAGREEAVLLTPQELEQLEDARDAALLRAAMADDDGAPGTTLEALAAELNIDLAR